MSDDAANFYCYGCGNSMLVSDIGAALTACPECGHAATAAQYRTLFQAELRRQEPQRRAMLDAIAAQPSVTRRTIDPDSGEAYVLDLILGVPVETDAALRERLLRQMEQDAP